MAKLIGIRGAMAMALLALAVPAQAQFSDGYKFLEAVKKRDGTKVNDMLAEPGTTIVNTRDVVSGESALHVVTARRDLTWMAFLIGKGANINARDRNGVTPLVVASNLGFIEGVELLIERKALVDVPNSAGETPLISAVHRRNIPMMRLLLKAGADPDRADNSGRTARDYAAADGKTSPLLAEIETNARPKAQRGSRPVYGPKIG